MESNITQMDAIKCTLGPVQKHCCYMVNMHINANSVNKTTSSVSLQHCAQYRVTYSVCTISVPHK